jgi:hypothetical protein
VAANKTQRPARRVVFTTTCISAILIGVLIYDIITDPDEGGVWDGFVPTWLGGEGPEGGKQ